ncbi:Saccharopine dehydrogenase, NADP-dependent [Bosea sp. 62]|uniref:SDR family oxidoreductase n=1 Tax=unclassified Bosea (in: a-proteobacteria) TaxID=2653178 RepID=UPI0012558B18|nr:MULTISPECIES: SDR family oxidoreductase [unclassified Bosea (in: a-proteobacteria)]CAD5288898.1 Saccharopine dehydrogenase, NADP-dependent [Bosea sp. 7B]CAD5300345.1 Saccharopine dehydrogenase, NADP-dependent [Bosea sp. 21B]CAD5300935.1 Saccharopine dehydrogenase, NADP-dependent [Bosea sp. 46]VVT62047.1 Saccharopine dehydrogenase, NADP-dependent [Bosea sp. EC-HK365B]VXB51742.1 Saccharopine dehydrogenase, NADP-dependent [Bosea sp. 125]
MRRVVLIGATGVFGRRLARHLSRMNGLDLILTSRSAGKAQALAQDLAAEASVPVSGAGFDRDKDLVASLSALKPWLVIDASGPFQHQGYEVPTAALLLGAHIVDLADARGYLAGYGPQLDEIARQRGLVALAGASSTPALSAAAARELSEGWQRLDTLDIAITPGGRSEVGPAVIAAVLSYAGRPVPVWREGELQTTSGWETGEVIDMPGLGPRRVAPVETVDAETLGPDFAVRSRVSFAAGLEAGIEQWGLALLAWLRRHGWVADLAPLVPYLVKARRITRLWTSDRGGMRVAISGIDSKGRPRRAYWSLLAENDDGPQVPTLAAAAAVRALLADEIAPGARSAAEALDLAAIEAEMAPYAISTSQDERTVGPALFETVLGAQAFAMLPATIRAFHAADAEPVWRGRADIARGDGAMIGLLCRLFGLPTAGTDLPVTVSVARGDSLDESCETWTRNFAGQRFHSRLSVDRNGELREAFGPFSFTLAAQSDREGLALPIANWRVFGLPLPRFLMPSADARETVDADGRFRFDVKLSLPFFGLLAHYRGWLKPRGPSDGPG